MDDGIQLAQYKLIMETYLSWERNFWTKFQILVGIQLALIVILTRVTLGATLVSQSLLIGVSILLVILSRFTWKILRWEVEDQAVLIRVVRSLEWGSRGRLYLLKRFEEVEATLTPKERTSSERFGRKPKFARDLSRFLFVVSVILSLFLLVPWVVRCAIALLL